MELLSIAHIRDWIIVIYGLLGIVFLTASTLLVVFLFFTFKGLKNAVRDLLQETVKPTLDSVRETAQSVRGTTDFVGQTAVRPIIRTYGLLAGVRRGASVLAGLTGRKRG